MAKCIIIIILNIYYNKHFTVSKTALFFTCLAGKFLKTPWCSVSEGVIDRNTQFCRFFNGFDIMVNWLPYKDIQELMLPLCKTVKNLLSDL